MSFCKIKLLSYILYSYTFTCRKNSPVYVYVGLIKIYVSFFTFHKLKQVSKCRELYGFTQIGNYDILFVYILNVKIQ